MDVSNVDLSIQTMKKANELKKALFAQTFEILCDKLDFDLSNEDSFVFQIADVMSYVRDAMEVVEQTPLKGDEQKQLVIKLIKNLLEKANVDFEAKESALQILHSGVVGQTIDLIVDASKGKLNMNRVAEVVAEKAKEELIDAIESVDTAEVVSAWSSCLGSCLGSSKKKPLPSTSKTSSK